MYFILAGWPWQCFLPRLRFLKTFLDWLGFGIYAYEAKDQSSSETLETGLRKTYILAEGTTSHFQNLRNLIFT